MNNLKVNAIETCCAKCGRTNPTAFDTNRGKAHWFVALKDTTIFHYQDGEKGFLTLNDSEVSKGADLLIQEEEVDRTTQIPPNCYELWCCDCGTEYLESLKGKHE